MTAATPQGWRVISLSEVGDFLSGGTPDRSNSAYWGGDIPWVTAKDLKSFYLHDSIERLSKSGSEKGSRTVPPNSILVLVRGMTLMKDVPVAVTMTAMAFNQDIKAIRANNNYDAKFIAYCLVNQKEQLRSFVDVAGHGTGRLATELLQSLPVKSPALPEQQRIAALLSTWDRAIELTEKLIAAKQKRKAALMEQLLTGQVRLPGFADEWTSLKMGDIFKRRSESGISQLPILSVTMDRGLIRRDSIERKMDSALDSEEHLLVRKGDIAYNMMRMWQGASGLALEDGVVSPAYVVLKPVESVDPLFAAYFFKLRHTVKQFENYSFGLTSDRLRLYFNDFAAILTKFPPLLEQQKIAAILSTQDQEIELHTQKMDALRRQKKGLMQQLLTGKIRVHVPDEPPGG